MRLSGQSENESMTRGGTRESPSEGQLAVEEVRQQLQSAHARCTELARKNMKVCCCCWRCAGLLGFDAPRDGLVFALHPSGNGEPTFPFPPSPVAVHNEGLFLTQESLVNFRLNPPPRTAPRSRRPGTTHRRVPNHPLICPSEACCWQRQGM